jgi:hypothetical protein
MSTGYVYILQNASMPNLVKIGRTRRTPKSRAQELRSTGVPDEFTVIYYERVSDHEKVEKRLSERLRPYRYRNDREFFRMEVADAISALLHECSSFSKPKRLRKRSH